MSRNLPNITLTGMWWYMNNKAVAKQALKSRFERPRGSLILITSVNPTPFGEGKTVTTIGLTQALNHIGQNASKKLSNLLLISPFIIKSGNNLYKPLISNFFISFIFLLSDS